MYPGCTGMMCVMSFEHAWVYSGYNIGTLQHGGVSHQSAFESARLLPGGAGRRLGLRPSYILQLFVQFFIFTRFLFSVSLGWALDSITMAPFRWARVVYRIKGIKIFFWLIRAVIDYVVISQ